jgi:hypothetical protein
MWTHIREIGPGKAFKNAIDFEGDRCDVFACPKQFGGAFNGDDGSPPGFPWAQDGGPGASATGSQFFDPAYTMSKRLSFPQPFSLDYCFNPYLAIADSCPTTKEQEPNPRQPAPQPTPGSTAPPIENAAASSDDEPQPTARESGCAIAPGIGAGVALEVGTHFALALAVVLRRRRRGADDVTTERRRPRSARPPRRGTRGSRPSRA